MTSRTSRGSFQAPPWRTKNWPRSSSSFRTAAATTSTGCRRHTRSRSSCGPSISQTDGASRSRSSSTRTAMTPWRFFSCSMAWMVSGCPTINTPSLVRAAACRVSTTIRNGRGMRWPKCTARSTRAGRSARKVSCGAVSSCECSCSPGIWRASRTTCDG